jgi:hypothetical protein
MTSTKFQARLRATAVPGKPPPRIGLADFAWHIPQGELPQFQETLSRTGSAARWRFDKEYRVLVVPGDDESQAKKLLSTMRRTNLGMWCVYVCDGEPEVLPRPVSIFNADGSVTTLAVCKQCIIAQMQHAVDQFFSAQSRLIIHNHLPSLTEPVKPLPFATSQETRGETWPQVPLAGAIWTLMSDMRGLGPLVKAWVTGIVDYAARNSRHLITFCPDHPLSPLRIPPPGQAASCRQADCKYEFCKICAIWHLKSATCGEVEIPGAKRCPRCRIPVFKFEGCNHITCRCGCHWCYLCTKGFDEIQKCYTHMSKKHGGWFVPVRV